ncbi:MAG: hypothetical protein QOE69_1107 [Thermoleophilaceae bacterium]|nr:hypothetical protein [Thermoleophilaceae bacterium]
MAAARPTATRARIRADVLPTRRAAVRMALPSRPRRRASGPPSEARGAGSFGSFRAVEGFYIAGGVLAAWALIVSAIGVMRPDFPSGRATTRLVGAISVVLVVAAIGLAIYLSATEEHEQTGAEHAALIPGG